MALTDPTEQAPIWAVLVQPVIFVRDLSAPTVVANVWAETWFPVAKTV